MNTKEYRAKWQRENKDKVHRSTRKYRTSEKGQATTRRWIAKRHGLTIEAYDRMFVEAKNKCEICSRTSSERLHVDHDHKTGINRGLLCSNCNTAIGLMRDDIGTLAEAISYIRRYHERSRSIA